MERERKEAVHFPGGDATASSVPTAERPRTRPPNLRPLDEILPDDLRVERTRAAIELMQSLAPPSVKTTGTGATRLDRDVKRWREEAGQVSDILLRREHDEREARAAAATRMRDPLSTTPQRPTDDRPVCSSTSHRSAKPRDVAWVRSYRPESVGQIFDEAAAAERAAKRAAAKAAREARRAAGRGRDRGETSAAAAAAAAAAREGRPLASAWRRARAAVRSLTGAGSRAARLAEAEVTAAEARRLKEARDARRDGAFDANLVLADELREMDARESSRIRSSAVEFFAAPGETIVAPFGDASAPSASARTRANPHTRANPLLGGSASVPASPTRRESHPRASSSSSRSFDSGGISQNVAPRVYVVERGAAEVRVAADPSRLEYETRVAAGGDFREGSRLVATLARGHVFGDAVVMSQLYALPRGAFVVAVDASESADAPTSSESDRRLVAWTLPASAYDAMTSSLMRRRAALESSLRAVPILSDRILSPAQRAFLGDAARRESWNVGQSIARQGWDGSCLCVIESGRAIAHARRRSQNVRGLGNFAPGAFFGELALTRDVARAATVTARDVTRTLSIDGAAFRATLKGALGAEGDALALTLADARAAELRALRVRDEARFRERDPGVVARARAEAGEVETTRSDPDAILNPTPGSDTRGPSRILAPAPVRTDGWDDDAAGVDGSGEAGTNAAEDAARRKIFGKPPDRDVKRRLVDALLRTAPFSGVGRPVRDDAAAAADRARARRLAAGEMWAIRGNPAFAAAVVDEGRLHVLGGERAGDFAREHLHVVDDEDDEATDPAAAAAAADAVSLDHLAPGADAPAKLLETARPGDCVGVGAWLHPGSRWEVHAVAAAPTTVWEITAEDFQSAAGAVVDDKRDRYAATVDACAPFRALTPSQRRRVADALREASFAPGETVFRQGALAPVGKDADTEVDDARVRVSAPPDGVFVVEKGAAVATAVAPGSTRSEVIRAYRRGDAFGAASALDGSRRAMTVTAIEAACGARDGGGGGGAPRGAPGWARVAFAVITRDALDQLGFLRDALARAEGCE